MFFTDSITGMEYNTSNYLESFMDEYTGEVKPGAKVLNKRVRKLWFRSHYPLAVIKNTVTMMAVPNSPDIPAGNAALAHVQIYNEGSLIAENHALRRAVVSTDHDNSFEYYTEAAINAAVERCLIDLGFVVSEEIEPAAIPSSGVTATKQSQKGAPPIVEKKIANANDARRAISEIESLIDSETVIGEAEKATFDKNTPVEDIIKVLSPADARGYVFTCRGKYEGKTVGEVYEVDKDKNGHSKTLQWFANHFVGKDNILVAACCIVNK